MLKYLTHKLKTQSINEENSIEKVKKFVEKIYKITKTKRNHRKKSTIKCLVHEAGNKKKWLGEQKIKIATHKNFPTPP